ncbi:MAG: FAD-binding oxidoreductase [Patescibacteria group bacterium]
MMPDVEARRAAYEAKKQALSASVRERNQHKQAGETLALGGKTSSNLFRVRGDAATRKVATINVRDLNQVIDVDAENLVAEVEGMTRYEDFVEATLTFNCLPTVVPELKSITVGGAATGIGIESSSFKYGLVHETILEMDVLLGNGDVVTCTADNEHRDLFFGFPNSYGTLGYALRLKVKLIKAKPFVKVERKTYTDAQRYFADMKALSLKARQDGSVDYIDGAWLGGKLYLQTGTFVDTAPHASDYTFLNIFYKSIPKKPIDYLTAKDYIWRWDTDWFWCSRFFLFENPLVRLIFGRKNLRSTTYMKIKNFFDKHDAAKKFEFIRGRNEPVIQDVEIPVEHAPDFLSFFTREIGINYLWMCPTMAYDPTKKYDLYAMDPSTLYVNFGFWDGVQSDKEDGHYNRLIEKKTEELHGKKSLYSTSYYSSEEFWKLYNKPRYEELKKTYDPGASLKDLYQKCVQRT